MAVSYVHDHLNYPATDVEGCYAKVLAPTAGIITHTRRKDTWVEEIDDPATRGGLTITLVGDDTVRYFFSHLGRVKVSIGQRVQAGDWIGVVGSSGNARYTLCHTILECREYVRLPRYFFCRVNCGRGDFWMPGAKEFNYRHAKRKNRLIKLSPDLCAEATTAFRANLSGRMADKLITRLLDEAKCTYSVTLFF